MNRFKDEVLVLGGGLAGLSAGHALAKAGVQVSVLERDARVGGLAKTVVHGPFRFDLGGHRFSTEDKGVEALVHDLLGHEITRVRRKSQILLRGRHIDYPLRPLNAILGLGAPTTLKAALDYALEKLKGEFRPSPRVSLEDWVVGNFGRTLFDIYFKQYSEKVWGVPCNRISAEWVEQRIKGLSLGVAVQNAFLRTKGNTPSTLTEGFLYPSRGIGRIAERLSEEIERENRVLCGVEVSRLRHEAFRIKGAMARRGPQALALEARAFISTLPMSDLVRMLDPSPPGEVLRAAARLRFRDLVVVAVMLDTDRATDQSWIYIPEPQIPFGRIHEPTNWSRRMAPAGKTLLVTEWFCFRGDEIWRASDQELGRRTVHHLASLGFIKEGDVAGWVARRVPKAYPLLEGGYEAHVEKVREYLGRFENLFMAGRGGLFRYYNMDHAMASGMEAAGKAMDGGLELREPDQDGWILAGQTA